MLYLSNNRLIFCIIIFLKDIMQLLKKKLSTTLAISLYKSQKDRTQTLSSCPPSIIIRIPKRGANIYQTKRWLKTIKDMVKKGMRRICVRYVVHKGRSDPWEVRQVYPLVNFFPNTIKSSPQQLCHNLSPRQRLGDLPHISHSPFKSPLPEFAGTSRAIRMLSHQSNHMSYSSCDESILYLFPLVNGLQGHHKCWVNNMHLTALTPCAIVQ